VELPFNFPCNSPEPTVLIESHDLGGTLTVDDHVPGSRLCLQMRNSGDIDLATGGLPELMSHVGIHLWRVVLKKHAGTYPGPTWEHFPDGPLQYQRERLPDAMRKYADPRLQPEIPARRSLCPCGKGKRFSECCEQLVRSVRHEFREIRKRVRNLDRLHGVSAMRSHK
jgi:hypothetical protein